MIRLTDVDSGFSLLELTISLGLTALCLTALLGLLPFGIETNQDGIAQTTTASILSSVIADFRATPRTESRSPQYGVTFGIPQFIYLNDDGRPVTPTDWTTVPRYKITITFPPTGTTSPSLTFISLRITWPALAISESTTPARFVEIFVALDRN